MLFDYIEDGLQILEHYEGTLRHVNHLETLIMNARNKMPYSNNQKAQNKDQGIN